MSNALLRDVAVVSGADPFVGARAGTAERSDLVELFGLMRAEPGEMSARQNVRVPVRHLGAGESLYHEGDSAAFVYFVRSGTFKIFHTELDGYEQVLGFVGRREVLAFDALGRADHPTAAIALEYSTVFALASRDLYSLGQTVDAFGRMVHSAVSVALNRQAELADVMSAASSEVRLARFLVNLSRRMSALGESGRRLRLRMSRRDIASHLGVAHETISRCLQALSDWAFVQVKNRDIEIVDSDALQVFAQGTRRQAGSAGRSATLALPRAVRDAETKRAPFDKPQRRVITHEYLLG